MIKSRSRLSLSPPRTAALNIAHSSHASPLADTQRRRPKSLSPALSVLLLRFHWMTHFKRPIFRRVSTYLILGSCWDKVFFVCLFVCVYMIQFLRKQILFSAYKHNYYLELCFYGRFKGYNIRPRRLPASRYEYHP